jgi:phosphoglycolate phosphatase/putative hydrolase of the HAD superfamily
LKIYRRPARIAAFLFDMDMTLYTNPEYERFQIDSPIRRLAELRGIGFEEMKGRILAFRRDWAAAHGGQQISLGNLFRSFGVSIEESSRWREELYEPSRFLRRDPKLREALSALGEGRRDSAAPPAKVGLALVTNNPVLVARKTLAVLGVEDLFTALVGLDTCGVSKPHEAPFLKAAELLGAPPETCVSVGDRYDIDIALPLELGMGGILVDGVEDVYTLPAVFFAPQ